MHKPTFQEIKTKAHTRETYTRKEAFQYCGSMFFWYYSIIRLSGFNYMVSNDGKKRTEEVDVAERLALQLVRFTTSFITTMGRRGMRPFSYKKLTIAEGLIFDKQSDRNRELREKFEGTELEQLLDKENPPSYERFFDGIDDNSIDKINMSKSLLYLPKEMFLDSTVWLYVFDENKISRDLLRDAKILGLTWGEFVRTFQFAIWTFVDKPLKADGYKGPPEYRTADYLFNEYKENRKKFFDKLEWKQDRTLRYPRNLNPSSDNRESIMKRAFKLSE